MKAKILPRRDVTHLDYELTDPEGRLLTRTLPGHSVGGIVAEFTLTKAQIKERDGHVKVLNETHSRLIDSVATYNQIVAAAYAELKDVWDDLTTAVAAAKEFTDDVASGWTGDADDKSEKWQESEAAETVRSLISSWEEWCWDDEANEPQEPDEVSDPENPADTLADLPVNKGDL